MKPNKSKKSAGDMMWIVVMLALSLLFLAIYTGAFNKLFGRETSSIKEQFNAAGDEDNDGVINIADKCPCPAKGFGIIENDGCPKGYKIKEDGKNEEDRSCFTKKT